MAIIGGRDADGDCVGDGFRAAEHENALDGVTALALDLAGQDSDGDGAEWVEFMDMSWRDQPPAHSDAVLNRQMWHVAHVSHADVRMGMV